MIATVTLLVLLFETGIITVKTEGICSVIDMPIKAKLVC